MAAMPAPTEVPLVTTIGSRRMTTRTRSLRRSRSASALDARLTLGPVVPPALRLLPVLTARILPLTAGEGAPAIIAPMTTIAVVADDLIWASRLTDAVRRAGAEPRRIAGAAVASRGTAAAVDPEATAIAGCDGAIVDTALRTTDPMTVITHLHAVGLPVLAVANHDDVGLRKRALAAGASKVLAYRKLHDDGPAVIATWMQAVLEVVP